LPQRLAEAARQGPRFGWLSAHASLNSGFSHLRSNCRKASLGLDLKMA
jgi:hypothetical protein